MDIRTRRPGRSALSLGLGVALIAATGVAAAAPAVSALASQASAARPATAARPAAAAAPTSVHATVIKTIGVAGPGGQGPIASTCSTGSPITCELWARPGTVTVNDGATIPQVISVWTFASTAAGDPGGASAPLVGTVGVPMEITVHNQLPGSPDLGLSIPQLDGENSQFSNPDGSPKLVSAGPAGSTYSFTPTRAGTYTYEAGLTADGSRQVAMGLVGGLVVRPALPLSATASAYDVAEDGWDDEALLVYTDVDTNLAANPATFNMRDYNPRFHLINGVAYPDTTSVFTGQSRTVLLRVVNGSILEKSPTLLGTRMNVFARGSRPLAASAAVSGRLVATGDTFDATIATGTSDTRFALYDSPGHLSSGTTLAAGSVNAPALGGAVTFIQVGGTTGVNPQGPLVSAGSAAVQPGSLLGTTTAVPGRGLTFTATFDASRDVTDMIDAQYYIDSLASTPVTINGFAAAAATQTVSWNLLASDFAGLSSGIHTMYVRGRDSLATGPLQVIKFRVDNDGPAVSALVLSDPVANGTLAVDVSATLDERAKGGSNATVARTWIDGTQPDGSDALFGPIALNVNGPRLVAAADGTFTAPQILALPEGPHTVYVQGQDEFGQWGTAASTPLVVDITAPVTTAITLTPTATNGLVGSPNKPGYVTIKATVTDASAVTGVQGYLDAVKPAASANGLYFSPLGGGQWTTDMPLSWLASRKLDGPITVVVVGTDAAGNRGDGTAPVNVTASLLIDRVNPLINIANLAQGAGFRANRAVSLAQGAGYLANRTISYDVTMSDASAGVAYAEWFVGRDPGRGRATPIAIPGAPVTGSPVTAHLTYDLWSRHIINSTTLSFNVRTRDAAGNWSQVTKPLTTQSLALFVNGFENDQMAAWTAGQGNGVPRFTTTPGIRLQAARSLYVGVRSRVFLGVDLTTPTRANQDLASLHASFLLGTRPGVNQVVTGCAVGANPNTCQPNGVMVFRALNSAGQTVVTVEYGRATATSPVRFRIGTRQAGGFVFGSWATRNPAANTNTVTIDWNPGSVQLRVNSNQLLSSRGIDAAATAQVVQIGAINYAGPARGNLAFDAVNLA